MGLSVGVVTIEYLDEPTKPVSDFLARLKMDPDTGLDDDDDYDWGGGWTENAIVEFTRGSLEKRARNWCDAQRIEPSGRAALLNWIAGLPWKGGYVMLHIGA